MIPSSSAPAGPPGSKKRNLRKANAAANAMAKSDASSKGNTAPKGKGLDALLHEQAKVDPRQSAKVAFLKREEDGKLVLQPPDGAKFPVDRDFVMEQLRSAGYRWYDHYDPLMPGGILMLEQNGRVREDARRMKEMRLPEARYHVKTTGTTATGRSPVRGSLSNPADGTGKTKKTVRKLQAAQAFGARPSQLMCEPQEKYKGPERFNLDDDRVLDPDWVPADTLAGDVNRLSSSASEGSDSDPKKSKTSKGLRKGARTQMLDFQRAGTVEMEEKQAELHAAVGGTEEMMRRHNLEIPRGHDELVNGHVVRRTSTEYDWQDLTPTALKKRQELAESMAHKQAVDEALARRRVLDSLSRTSSMARSSSRVLDDGGPGVVGSRVFEVPEVDGGGPHSAETIQAMDTQKRSWLNEKYENMNAAPVRFTMNLVAEDLSAEESAKMMQKAQEMVGTRTRPQSAPSPSEVVGAGGAAPLKRRKKEYADAREKKLDERLRAATALEKEREEAAAAAAAAAAAGAGNKGGGKKGGQLHLRAATTRSGTSLGSASGTKMLTDQHTQDHDYIEDHQLHQQTTAASRSRPGSATSKPIIPKKGRSIDEAYVLLEDISLGGSVGMLSGCFRREEEERLMEACRRDGSPVNDAGLPVLLAPALMEELVQLDLANRSGEPLALTDMAREGEGVAADGESANYPRGDIVDGQIVAPTLGTSPSVSPGKRRSRPTTAPPAFLAYAREARAALCARSYDLLAQRPQLQQRYDRSPPRQRSPPRDRPMSGVLSRDPRKRPLSAVVTSPSKEDTTAAFRAMHAASEQAAGTTTTQRASSAGARRTARFEDEALAITEDTSASPEDGRGTDQTKALVVIKPGEKKDTLLILSAEQGAAAGSSASTSSRPLSASSTSLSGKKKRTRPFSSTAQLPPAPEDRVLSPCGLGELVFNRKPSPQVRSGFGGGEELYDIESLQRDFDEYVYEDDEFEREASRDLSMSTSLTGGGSSRSRPQSAHSTNYHTSSSARGGANAAARPMSAHQIAGHRPMSAHAAGTDGVALPSVGRPQSAAAGTVEDATENENKSSSTSGGRFSASRRNNVEIFLPLPCNRAPERQSVGDQIKEMIEASGENGGKKTKNKEKDKPPNLVRPPDFSPRAHQVAHTSGGSLIKRFNMRDVEPELYSKLLFRGLAQEKASSKAAELFFGADGGHHVGEGGTNNGDHTTTAGGTPASSSRNTSRPASSRRPPPGSFTITRSLLESKGAASEQIMAFNRGETRTGRGMSPARSASASSPKRGGVAAGEQGAGRSTPSPAGANKKKKPSRPTSAVLASVPKYGYGAEEEERYQLIAKAEGNGEYRLSLETGPPLPELVQDINYVEARAGGKGAKGSFVNRKRQLVQAAAAREGPEGVGSEQRSDEAVADLERSASDEDGYEAQTLREDLVQEIANSILTKEVGELGSPDKLLRSARGGGGASSSRGSFMGAPGSSTSRSKFSQMKDAEPTASGDNSVSGDEFASVGRRSRPQSAMRRAPIVPQVPAPVPDTNSMLVPEVLRKEEQGLVIARVGGLTGSGKHGGNQHGDGDGMVDLDGVELGEMEEDRLDLLYEDMDGFEEDDDYNARLGGDTAVLRAFFKSSQTTGSAAASVAGGHGVSTVSGAGSSAAGGGAAGGQVGGMATPRKQGHHNTPFDPHAVNVNDVRQMRRELKARRGGFTALLMPNADEEQMRKVTKRGEQKDVDYAERQLYWHSQTAESRKRAARHLVKVSKGMSIKIDRHKPEPAQSPKGGQPTCMPDPRKEAGVGEGGARGASPTRTGGGDRHGGGGRTAAPQSGRSRSARSRSPHKNAAGLKPPVASKVKRDVAYDFLKSMQKLPHLSGDLEATITTAVDVALAENKAREDGQNGEAANNNKDALHPLLQNQQQIGTRPGSAGAGKRKPRHQPWFYAHTVLACINERCCKGQRYYFDEPRERLDHIVRGRTSKHYYPHLEKKERLRWHKPDLD